MQHEHKQSGILGNKKINEKIPTVFAGLDTHRKHFSVNNGPDEAKKTVRPLQRVHVVR
jgi:hypothetical protein